MVAASRRVAQLEMPPPVEVVSGTPLRSFHFQDRLGVHLQGALPLIAGQVSSRHR